MPQVSLGHPDDGGNETTSALNWFEVGGTGIDTAFNYYNQDQVGEAFRQSGVTREKVFITTKITCPPDPIPGPVTPQKALAAVKRNLGELGMDYVDLMLLHFPCTTGLEDTLAAWRGLQDAQAQGLVRAVGVSNFMREHLDAVMALGGTPPAVNQCNMSIGSHDDDLIAYTKSLGITFQAYSPLRHMSLLVPVISRVAAAHGVSNAQVALRWINQQGVLLATSPGLNEEFMAADLDLGAFTLTEEEMSTLGALQDNGHIAINNNGKDKTVVASRGGVKALSLGRKHDDKQISSRYVS
eukprot:CAMPEP_0198228966 /NCGR_PEP_ID=MMETSP1445-20131203/113876_1 /TAXON_ID=36898 /ORGANISM="Pyramimonas sp., Strain CCMP2087" /LENGTH=296 /DNA_ID=CAMNT_0043909403 /DNA_START=722 /DNA_END=1612 /DNA_ORIENTATION=-